MRGRWLAPLTGLLAVIVLAAGPSARADTSGGARSELERGYELRRKGNYVEALPHLLESYRLDPQMKTLLNLADSEEHVGKLVDARNHWKAALAQASAQRDGDIRQEAQRRIGALDGRIPSLKIRLPADAPAGCTVELDGVPVAAGDIGVLTPTDPGRRTVVVRAPGHESRSVEVILATAEAREVLVPLGPELPAPPSVAPPPAVVVQPEVPERPVASGSSLRYVGLAVAGVGVVGVGLGTFFGLTAINKRNDANCPSNVCTGPSGQPAVLRDAVSAGNVSTVFFIAGAALVAGGATLWLVAPRGGRTTALAVAPTMASHAGGLALAGRW